MRRSHQAGKPFYLYLPYTQVHIPPIPDPQYAGTTKHGSWADILTQIDDFTGQIIDELDTLGVAGDTIVLWASDNGPDSDYRFPAIDPDPVGGPWAGFGARGAGRCSPHWRAPNRTPCIVRWPGKVPAGRVSNELVHEVDLFTTLVLAGGGSVPSDRMIDGMDMRGFLLGQAEESGRNTVLCFQANRLQAVKWRQWKVHLFHQDDMVSTWTPYNGPLLYNLEWDPREEHQIDFPHGWVLHPMAAAAGAFLKSLVIEPPVKPGTPDPYTPPKPGQLVPQEHLQIGPIVQFVTTLHHPNGQPPDVREHQPEHGLNQPHGA